MERRVLSINVRTGVRMSKSQVVLATRTHALDHDKDDHGDDDLTIRLTTTKRGLIINQGSTSVLVVDKAAGIVWGHSLKPVNRLLGATHFLK